MSPKRLIGQLIIGVLLFVIGIWLISPGSPLEFLRQGLNALGEFLAR